MKKTLQELKDELDGVVLAANDTGTAQAAAAAAADSLAFATGADVSAKADVVAKQAAEDALVATLVQNIEDTFPAA